MNWEADPLVTRSSRRLLVHVEGLPEQTFVNQILAPHLYEFGYSKVAARLVGNARNRSNRGGTRGWRSVRRDIVRHLKEDSDCYATTMLDFYGMVQDGPNAWPKRKDASMTQYELKCMNSRVYCSAIAKILRRLLDDPRSSTTCNRFEMSLIHLRKSMIPRSRPLQNALNP